MFNLDLKEWVIVGAAGLAIFGIYSYKHSSDISKPMFEVSDSYEMIRPTEVYNSLDLSGRRVIRLGEQPATRDPQKTATTAKVDPKKEDPKKVAEQKKKEEEAKKKAAALAAAKKKASLQVTTIGQNTKSTFDQKDSTPQSNNNNDNYYYQPTSQNTPEVTQQEEKKDEPRTLAEWERDLFGAQLEKKTLTDLIKAHQNKKISPNDYMKLVTRMLHDQSHGGIRQTKAIEVILETDISAESFAVAVIYIKEISPGDPLVTKLERIIGFYNDKNSPSKLPILAKAMAINNVEVKKQALDFAEPWLAKIKPGTQSEGRQPAGATLADLRSTFKNPLASLASSSDQDLSSRAKGWLAILLPTA